ncbi:MAG: hypothetical protein Q4C61_11140 [Lachnospiraceae bacterium]|nr:hypothetical protein [Lachnospiraceae bacterium]
MRSSNKRNTVLTAAGLTLFVFVLIMWVDNTSFPYDSGQYWKLGKSFFDEDGHFSLLSYPQHIRGYFFPLLIGLCRQIGAGLFGNRYVVYRFVISLVTVLMITVILPGILEVKTGTRRWMAGSAAGVAVFLLFWKDMLIYPLSDVPALAMYLSVILILKKIFRTPKKGKKNFLLCGALSVLAGALAYGAYNTRSVYMIPLFITMLIWVIFVVAGKQTKKLLCILGIVLGTAVFAYPQTVINQNTFGVSSPMLQNNLFVYQLKWGVRMPRFETYIGDKAQYPKAKAEFVSELGENLLKENEIESIGDFVKCMLTHPFEACAIYFEHCVSGITMFYNDVYVNDIRVGKKLFGLNCLLYLMALAGLMAFGARKKKQNLLQKLLTLFVIAVPAILAMPGALEVRFFLPVYLLVYCYVFMIMDYREIWRFIREHWLVTGMTLVLAALIWASAAGHLLTELQYADLDFSGNVYLSEVTED